MVPIRKEHGLLHRVSCVIPFVNARHAVIANVLLRYRDYIAMRLYINRSGRFALPAGYLSARALKCLCRACVFTCVNVNRRRSCDMQVLLLEVHISMSALRHYNFT